VNEVCGASAAMSPYLEGRDCDMMCERSRSISRHRATRYLIYLAICASAATLAGCSQVSEKPSEPGGAVDTLGSDVGNQSPVAVAGADQQIMIGSPVDLDGSSSSDPDGDSLAYQWSVIIRPAGSVASLSSATTQTTSFTPDSVGLYRIMLVVSDGALSSIPDTVSITAIADTLYVNQRPVAIASATQMVAAGDSTQLDGTGSYDPDGDSLSWRWRIVSAPVSGAGALSDSTAVSPWLYTDSAGDYGLELVVSDGLLQSLPGSLSVTASPAPVVDSCVSNPNVVFTHDITDLSQISLIVPPGSVSGNVIKTHSYIENKPGVSVPVYAPADCILYNGAKMLEGGEIQYLLFFRASCEVRFILDHITTVVDTIATLFPGPPAISSQTGPDFANPIAFPAGTLLGYTTGTQQARRWDFGVYNTTVTNTFGNNLRYENSYAWRWLEAVCPYDLYPVTMRAQYENLYGGAGGILVGSGATCRNPSQDSIGTIRGMWFPDNDPNSFAQNTLAISSTFDAGQVRIGGPGWQMWIYDTNPTFVDPATVTTEHCYSAGSAVAYFKLVSATELRVYYDSTSSVCPGSFPASGYVTYWR